MDSPLLVFAFPVRLLLPIPADAAVGVLRGFVGLASPTAKLWAAIFAGSLMQMVS